MEEQDYCVKFHPCVLNENQEYYIYHTFSKLISQYPTQITDSIQNIYNILECKIMKYKYTSNQIIALNIHKSRGVIYYLYYCSILYQLKNNLVYSDLNHGKLNITFKNLFLYSISKLEENPMKSYFYHIIDKIKLLSEFISLKPHDNLFDPKYFEPKYLLLVNNSYCHYMFICYSNLTEDHICNIHKLLHSQKKIYPILIDMFIKEECIKTYNKEYVEYDNLLKALIFINNNPKLINNFCNTNQQYFNQIYKQIYKKLHKDSLRRLFDNKSSLYREEIKIYTLNLIYELSTYLIPFIKKFDNQFLDNTINFRLYMPKNIEQLTYSYVINEEIANLINILLIIKEANEKSSKYIAKNNIDNEELVILEKNNLDELKKIGEQNIRIKELCKKIDFINQKYNKTLEERNKDIYNY